MFHSLFFFQSFLGSFEGRKESLTWASHLPDALLAIFPRSGQSVLYHGNEHFTVMARTLYPNKKGFIAVRVGEKSFATTLQGGQLILTATPVTRSQTAHLPEHSEPLQLSAAQS